MKAVLLAAFLFVPVAHAQQSWNPSYDELIRGLSPKAAGATRGIRPVTPLLARPEPLAPPAASRQVAVHFAPPYHAPPPPQSRQSNDLASVQLQIPFETGSDRLTPAAVKSLDTLGRALSSSELGSYRFRIEGHTDAAGNSALNAALSARRADAVADYIVSHYGVDRTRLTPVGLGDSQMLVVTPPGVPEPRNRRVQIVNIGT